MKTRSRLAPSDFKIPYCDGNNKTAWAGLALHPCQWRRLEHVRKEFQLAEIEQVIRFLVCTGVYLLTRDYRYGVDYIDLATADISNDEQFERELQNRRHAFYEYLASGGFGRAVELVADCRRLYSFVPDPYLRARAFDVIAELERAISDTTYSNGKYNRCGPLR